MVFKYMQENKGFVSLKLSMLKIFLTIREGILANESECNGSAFNFLRLNIWKR